MKPWMSSLTYLGSVLLLASIGTESEAYTKAEADSILMYDVIGIGTVSHELISFGFDTLFPVGITIFPYWPEPLPAHVDSGFYSDSPYVTTQPTWFYWIDDNPYAGFVHETRYVYINDDDGTIDVEPGFWWPVVDSVEYWHDDSEYWDQSFWVWSNVSYIPPPAPLIFSLEPPLETPFFPAAQQEVCCLVLKGDKRSDFANGYKDMKAAFDSLGFQTTGLQCDNVSRDSLLKKLEEMCADADCPCIWISINSHGAIDNADNFYFTWGNTRVTSSSIKSKLDNCGNKGVCMTVQSCRSGELINDLGKHPRIKLITTATDSVNFALRDYPLGWDPNPWDKGSEYTSGFAEDLKILAAVKTSMRVARKVAQDSNTCVCEVLGSEAHNTALGKDAWANHPSNYAGFAEFPKQKSVTGLPVDTCEVGIGVCDSACVLFTSTNRKQKICFKCDGENPAQWFWSRGCDDCWPCEKNCNCTAVPAGTVIKLGGRTVPETTVVDNCPATPAGVENHWSIIIESDQDGCICLEINSQPGKCPFDAVNADDTDASGLLCTIAGSEGTLNDCIVTTNPPGCPEPVCTTDENTVFIDWGECCVPSGEQVEFEVASDFPCPQLEVESMVWIYEPTSVDDDEISTPTAFSLSQNYPNPFNAATVIKYGLPVNCDVRLIIYNVAGQRIRTLVDGPQTAGYKTAIWNGKNDEGLDVSSGIYLYSLTAGQNSEQKKMVILR